MRTGAKSVHPSPHREDPASAAARRHNESRNLESPWLPRVSRRYTTSDLRQSRRIGGAESESTAGAGVPRRPIGHASLHLRPSCGRSTRRSWPFTAKRRCGAALGRQPHPRAAAPKGLVTERSRRSRRRRREGVTPRELSSGRDAGKRLEGPTAVDLLDDLAAGTTIVEAPGRFELRVHVPMNLSVCGVAAAKRSAGRRSVVVSSRLTRLPLTPSPLSCAAADTVEHAVGPGNRRRQRRESVVVDRVEG